mmetsp:Transcript_40563/g.127872  ORF Transcript_40563/g.127872 Transcript_40563/m.127872 type:complete len:249 (-) Transcript_40563:877-1623(-)
MSVAEQPHRHLHLVHRLVAEHMPPPGPTDVLGLLKGPGLLSGGVAPSSEALRVGPPEVRRRVQVSNLARGSPERRVSSVDSLDARNSRISVLPWRAVAARCARRAVGSWSSCSSVLSGVTRHAVFAVISGRTDDGSPGDPNNSLGSVDSLRARNARRSELSNSTLGSVRSIRSRRSRHSIWSRWTCCTPSSSSSGQSLVAPRSRGSRPTLDAPNALWTRRTRRANLPFNSIGPWESLPTSQSRKTREP